LVQSSSVDSDDTDDSVLATSKTITIGATSRAENLTPLPEPGKPFDEEELTRALTRTQLEATA
jgi:hypothetical protein